MLEAVKQKNDSLSREVVKADDAPTLSFELEAVQQKGKSLQDATPELKTDRTLET